MDKDKLSDNWRFKEGRKPIDETTFNVYIEKYGNERALGYLDAIAYVKAEVQWMLHHTEPGAGGWQRNESKTAKLLRDFQKHKSQFIGYILNHPICDQDETLNQKLKQN